MLSRHESGAQHGGPICGVDRCDPGTAVLTTAIIALLKHSRMP